MGLWSLRISLDEDYNPGGGINYFRDGAEINAEHPIARPFTFAVTTGVIIMTATCHYLLMSISFPKGLFCKRISLLAFAIALVATACTSPSGFNPQSPSPVKASPRPTALSPDQLKEQTKAQTNTASESKSSPDSSVQTTANVSFEQAVMKAANATELADVAQTADDWQQVAQHWQSAIILLQTIPAMDEKFAIAQQRLPDYQKQQRVAQQQATQLAEKQANQHKKRAKQGEQLFQDIKGSYQLTNVLQGTPTLQVVVLNEQWRSLSKLEQMDVAEYAKSLVQSARSAPDQYVDVSASNPIYDRFVSKAASLCDDCWQIVVTDQSSISSFSDLKTVVQGDELWEKDDPCCRGKKVSEFVK